MKARTGFIVAAVIVIGPGLGFVASTVFGVRNAKTLPTPGPEVSLLQGTVKAGAWRASVYDYGDLGPCVRVDVGSGGEPFCWGEPGTVKVRTTSRAAGTETIIETIADASISSVRLGIYRGKPLDVQLLERPGYTRRFGISVVPSDTAIETIDGLDAAGTLVQRLTCANAESYAPFGKRGCVIAR